MLNIDDVDVVQSGDLGQLMRHADRLVDQGQLRRALRVYYDFERSAGAWWAELARHRGHVLDDLGRYDDALQAYATARQRAGGDPRLSMVITLNEAQIHGHRGESIRAVTVLQGLAESPALPADLAGSVQLALGSALQASGDPFGAVEAFGLASKAAAAQGDVVLSAGALFNTGNVLTSADELDAAEEAFVKARRLYSELGDPCRDADCLDALGVVMAYRDRFPEALTLHDAARGIYQTLARTGELAIAEQNCSWALLKTGRPTEALAAAARAVELHLSVGDVTAAWLARLSTIPALCALGRIDEARGVLDRCVATRPVLRADDQAYVTWITAWLGHFEGDEDQCRAGRQVAAGIFSSVGNFAAAREASDLPHRGDQD